MPGRNGAALLGRAAALGVATGSRSTLGLLAPVLANPARSRRATIGAGLAAAGEAFGDKLPTAPSRLEPPSLAARLVSAANGARLLARGRTPRPGLPAVAAAAAFAVAGAAAGSRAGVAWRRASASLLPNAAAGVVEDVVALGLATWACRRPAR